MALETSRVEPKDGFEWEKVNWTTPSISANPPCSYCDAEIPKDSAPFVIYGVNARWESTQATFCNTCADQWFGVKSYAPPPLEKPEGKEGPDDP